MSDLLIVDDDIDILEGLATSLADNHRVSTAPNGVRALELLARHSFDAVVLDLMMPFLDGETLLKDMRQRGITVPVLLTSASHDIAEVAKRLGVSHIAKPFDAAGVEEKLALLLQPR